MSKYFPRSATKRNEAVRRALVHMLAVAWGIPVADSEAALLDDSAEESCLKSSYVCSQIPSSPLCGAGYRTVTASEKTILPRLRGKLDIRRQLARHSFRADRLACSFDELSVDTPLNRVLKAAVARLASDHTLSRERAQTSRTGRKIRVRRRQFGSDEGAGAFGPNQ